MVRTDPPGFIYLMYCSQVCILKVGKTTKEPEKYLHNKYRPKQLWKKILLLPAEHPYASEKRVVQKCRTFLSKADGREYFFADIYQLDTVQKLMLDLTEEQQLESPPRVCET